MTTPIELAIQGEQKSIFGGNELDRSFLEVAIFIRETFDPFPGDAHLFVNSHAPESFRDVYIWHVRAGLLALETVAAIICFDTERARWKAVRFFSAPIHSPETCSHCQKLDYPVFKGTEALAIALERESARMMRSWKKWREDTLGEPTTASLKFRFRHIHAAGIEAL